MKQIKVGLQFSADTTQAKAEIASLQQALNNVISGANTKLSLGKGIATDLQQGKEAAIDLKAKLQACTNVDTGKLNLSQFSQSLQRSGKTLQDYQMKLRQLGPEGSKAFIQMAQQVAKAEAPLKKSNTLIDGMWNTLKNTAKWQISSKALMTLTSGLSNAYRFAQDLNKSLTSIQIVTKQSSEQMEKFAVEANKSAKALSSTTTAYTNAALIFYQQGLNDKQVKERTDSTIKMANVTGKSVTEISNQMTAIWNNFDDGSQSLEHYGDVLTKLGATTASSSSEIADGMQKFAAVAETVGLSYENAAAALATVTAATRQSADIVGTAFKTLFSRMEQLKQGETLEDGTSLGQYSQALKNVGVDIKTASGEMKSMDQIIDETGKRWKNLSQDQQIALAQQVAGIRQYQQFMALMNNYDAYTTNIETAKNSNGELEKQQEIYAQSWEGAQKRVKAGFETIFMELVDDDFFIDLNNGLADLLTGVDKLIKSMGGLAGFLPMVIALFTKLFGDKVINSIVAFNSNLRGAGAAIQELNKKQQTDALKGMEEETQFLVNKYQEARQIEEDIISGKRKITELTQEERQYLVGVSEEELAQLQSIKNSEEIQSEILKIKVKLTEEQKAYVNEILAGQKYYDEQVESAAREADIQKDKLKIIQAQIEALKIQRDYYTPKNETTTKATAVTNGIKDQLKNKSLAPGISEEARGKAETVFDNSKGAALAIDNFANEILPKEDIQGGEVVHQMLAELISDLEEIGNQNGVIDKIKEIGQAFNEATATGTPLDEALNKMREDLNSLNTVEEAEKEATMAMVKELRKHKISAEEMTIQIKEYIEALSKKHQLTTKEAVLKKQEERGIKETEAAMEKEKKATIDAAKAKEKYLAAAQKLAKEANRGLTFKNTIQGVSSLTMGLMSATTAINSIVGAIDKGSLSFSEFLGIVMSLSMAIPAISSAITSIGTAMGINNTVTALATGIQIAYKEAAEESSAAEMEQVLAKKLKKLATEQGIPPEVLASTVDKEGAVNTKKLTFETLKYKAALLLKKLGLIEEIPLTEAASVANIGLGASEQVALWPLLLFTAALIALGAIIFGIVKGIQALTKAYNADAIAAEEASKYAETTAKNYEELKKSYDDLKKSIEDYQAAANALDKLKVGTKEWKDAVVELNQQVLDLINNYPDLMKYVTNENGVLKISEEGEYAILDEQKEKANIAYNLNQEAQLNAKKLANNSTRTDLLRHELDLTGFLEDLGGVLKSTGEGAALGTVAAGAGTGSVVGGLIGAATGIKNKIFEEDTESSNALDAIQKAYNNNKIDERFFSEAITTDEMKTMLSGIGLNASDELVEALHENRNSVYDLIKSNKLLEEQEQLLTQQEVNNMLYNQEGFDSSHYGTNVQKIAANIYTAKKEDLEKTYSADSYHESVGLAERHTTAGKDTFIDYLVSQRGLTRSQAEKIYDDSDFKGDRIEFEISDQEDYIKYEDLQSFDVENELVKFNDEITNKINQITTIISNLSSGYTQNLTANAISSFLESGDFSSIIGDKARLEELKNLTLSEKELNKFIPAETLKDWGYESAEQFIKEFQSALNDYNVEEAYNRYLIKQQEEIQGKFKSASEELGINKSAFEMYSNELAKNTDESNKNAVSIADCAVAHYRLGKGIQSLRKTFQDNLDLLQASTNDSLDYYEALGQVKEQVEKTFGLKVSADFIKDNLSTIKKMADGDVEALAELKEKIIDDYIINLNIDDSYKIQLKNAMDDIANQIKDKKIGYELSLDNSKALEALNTALATGATTIEEVQSMFNNADLSMPEYHMASVPNLSHSVTESTVTDLVSGHETKTRSDTTTTTYTQVPYFGTNKPVYSLDPETETAKIEGYVDTTKLSGDDYKLTPEQQLEKYGNAGSAGDGPQVKKLSDKNSLTDIVNYDGKNKEKESEKNNKKIDDEIERNYTLKKKIDALSKSYDLLSKTKDRAYGNNRLKLIDREIASLNKQIEAQKNLNEANAQYLAQDAGLLKGYGAIFDESGVLLNYDQLMRNAVNQYNSTKDTDEKAEEHFNDFKKALNNYETSYNDFIDGQTKLIEKEWEQFDKKIEKITYEVEFKIELDDDAIEFLDFLKGREENKAYSNAKIAAYLGSKADANADKIKENQNGIIKILKEAGASEQQIQEFMQTGNMKTVSNLNLTKETIDQITEYLKDNLSNAEEIMSIQEELNENLMGIYEQRQEDLEKITNTLEYYTNFLQNYKDILNLIGKDKLGISDNTIKSINEAMLESSYASLNADKKNVDELVKYREDALNKYQKAVTEGNESAAKLWKENYDRINEDLEEANLKIQEDLKALIELAQQLFEEAIEEASKKFKESLGDLDQKKQDFDWYKEESEYYLQNYEKAYETNKLIRNITKSIDTSKNIKNQKVLNNLLKEVASYQEENKKMSEYDVKYLQKKYDLILAQQALIDAANAKDTVRLQRTQSGSYGYVYTANQDNVSNLAQKFDEALYQLTDLNYEHEVKMTEEFINLNIERVEKIKELRLEDFDNFQEYMDAVDAINDHYDEKQKYILGESEKVTQNWDSLLKNELREYISMDDQFNTTVNTTVQQFSSKNDEMSRKWNDTLLKKMFPDYQSYADLSDGVTQSVMDLADDAAGAWEDYQSRTHTALYWAGIDMGNLDRDVKLAADDIKNIQIPGLNNSIGSINTKAGQTWSELSKNLSLWQSQFNNILNGTSNNNSFWSVMNNFLLNVKEWKRQILEQFGQEEESDPVETAGGIVNNAPPTSPGNGTKTESPEPKIEPPKTVIHKSTDPSMLGYYMKYENHNITNTKDKAYTKGASTRFAPWFLLKGNDASYVKEQIQNAISAGTFRVISYGKDSQGNYRGGFINLYPEQDPDARYKWISLDDISLGKDLYYYEAYKKGGLVSYTGPAWVDGTPSSPEAFLNPLQTKLIGNLAEQLQLNAQTMKLNYSAPGFNREQLYNLQQEVTIHAEFPNATNHNEIEEAFNTLINRASQYVNRN